MKMANRNLWNRDNIRRFAIHIKNRSPPNKSSPIRTIYVKPFSQYPTYAQVLQAFSRYGKIRNVKLFPQCIYFFVTFEEPKSALRCLEDKFFMKVNCGYIVKVAEEWHQPIELSDGAIVWDRRHLNKMTVEANTRDDPSKADNLLDLPDDCLHHIFKYLTFKELIQIESVSKRMRSCSRMAWRRLQHLRVSSISSLPWTRMVLSDWRAVLERAGPFVQSVNLDHECLSEIDEIGLLNCIEKLCRNIKVLSLAISQFNDIIMGKLLSMNDRLESLTLHNKGWVVDYDLLSNLNKMTNLKSLSLKSVGVEDVKLDYAHDKFQFSNITHLSIFIDLPSHLLNAFPNLESLICKSVCGKVSLTKLKSLSLWAHPDIFQQCYDIAPNINELSVTMSGGDEYKLEALSLFERLNSLLIHHMSLTDSQLMEISNKLKNPLVQFTCHDSPLLTVGGIVRFLQAQPEITRLDCTLCYIEPDKFVSHMNQDRREKKLSVLMDLVGSVGFCDEEEASCNEINNVKFLTSIFSTTCLACGDLGSDDDDDSDSIDDFMFDGLMIEEDYDSDVDPDWYDDDSYEDDELDFIDWLNHHSFQ